MKNGLTKCSTVMSLKINKTILHVSISVLIGNEIRKLPVEMTRTYRTITGMTLYVTLHSYYYTCMLASFLLLKLTKYMYMWHVHF